MEWLNPKQGTPLPFFAQVRILKDLPVRLCNKSADRNSVFLPALAFDAIEVVESNGAVVSPNRLGAWKRGRSEMLRDQRRQIG